MRTKTLYTRDAEKAGISRFPNFQPHGEHNRHEAALLRKKRPIGTLRESDLQTYRAKPEIYYNMAH